MSIKRQRQLAVLALALLQIIALVACAETPDSIDRDGVIIAGTNNDEDKANHSVVPSENIPAPASKTPAEESLAIISASNGQHIKMDVDTPAGNKLCIDAVVETDGITQVSKYNYVLVPISEELRQDLFEARFGDRVSEFEYDELNNVWTLSNSSSVADYYLYNTYYPMAGETVPGEESFSLEYRKVDLYPFEDNLLESVSSSAVTLPLDEVISLCNQLVGAITNQEDYTVD